MNQYSKLVRRPFLAGTEGGDMNQRCLPKLGVCSRFRNASLLAALTLASAVAADAQAQILTSPHSKEEKL